MTDTTVQQLPQAGVWDIDSAHSSLEFTARHLMATRVRGRFTDWTAVLRTGAAAGDATVEATIQASSITTFNEARDNHLRTADFFDAENHPVITFRSTRIGELKPDGHFEVTGDLTARGTTRPVTLDAELVGVLQDPFGHTKVTIAATTELRRDDWGVSWNQPLANGGFLVSKSITVEVEAQFVLRTEEAAQG